MCYDGVCVLALKIHIAMFVNSDVCKFFHMLNFLNETMKYSSTLTLACTASYGTCMDKY